MFSFEVGRRPLVAILTTRSLVTKVLLFVIGGESSESRGLSPTHCVPWERALNNCTQLNKIIQNWTQLNTKPIILNFLGLAPEWGISQEASRDLEEMGTSRPPASHNTRCIFSKRCICNCEREKIKGYVQDNMPSESSSKHICPHQVMHIAALMHYLWCIRPGAPPVFKWMQSGIWPQQPSSTLHLLSWLMLLTFPPCRLTPCQCQHRMPLNTMSVWELCIILGGFH